MPSCVLSETQAPDKEECNVARTERLKNRVVVCAKHEINFADPVLWTTHAHPIRPSVEQNMEKAVYAVEYIRLLYVFDGN